MLELFERWLRSVGVDLFDLLAASCRQSLVELSPKYLLVAWFKLRQLAKHSAWGCRSFMASFGWRCFAFHWPWWTCFSHIFRWPNRSVKVWGFSKRKDFECFSIIFYIYYITKLQPIKSEISRALRHWLIVLFILPCICCGCYYWQLPSTPLRRSVADSDPGESMNSQLS